MVNANKHMALRVINNLTVIERGIRQENNRRKKYLKNKGKVNSCCNFHKEGFGKLEKHYNKWYLEVIIMDLIKEPNPAFTKQLFLQSLYDYNKAVYFKVLKLGNIFKSKMNGKPNFFVEMEILSDFPDCKILDLDLIGNPKTNEDGSKKVIKINAKEEIIGLPYELKPARNPDLYNISNKTNLFSLLNYAFICKGIVKAGNQQGFNNVSYDEISQALTGLDFWGKVVRVEKTTYKPYFKLVPTEVK